ncbi:TFB4 (YPR056W) [Zygosaccharomyces parabailii]|nr:TFB4 (YPR056W) [Zygosaccharomyces parabailii]CDH08598.1 probable RNA polymerase II transcription factor B subunit 4 [Zygosaccharomyces bailii ISA1307]
MDAISDPNFQPTKPRSHIAEETPSLLVVVVDTAPRLWAELDNETNQSGRMIEMLKSLLVFLNAHLAFNNSNQVAVIAAHSQGIKYLYPKSSSSHTSSRKGKDLSIINNDMYRQFRNVDETFVEELYDLFQQEKEQAGAVTQKSTLAGGMSAGLTYVNRVSKELETMSFKSRLLVVTCGSGGDRDEIFQYIPIMNCIFSATKLKCPIDVVKIGGSKESTFLQQTTDATQGVYLHVESTEGLIQYLATAMFIDPSLRQIIVKPNQGSVDFRTSCYLTGKVVAIGYICSVCLCVLSVSPPGNRCPACDSEFDERVISKLKRSKR